MTPRDGVVATQKPVGNKWRMIVMDVWKGCRVGGASSRLFISNTTCSGMPGAKCGTRVYLKQLAKGDTAVHRGPRAVRTVTLLLQLSLGIHSLGIAEVLGEISV